MSERRTIDHAQGLLAALAAPSAKEPLHSGWPWNAEDSAVLGRKDHDNKAVLSFIHDLNGPPPKIDDAIREKRNKSHRLISKANRCGMCGGYIAEISPDAIVKIFIRSG